jgi:hypothetical protein
MSPAEAQDAGAAYLLPASVRRTLILVRTDDDRKVEFAIGIKWAKQCS